MTAPFAKNEKVTIEQLANITEPEFGTEVQTWVPVLVRYWANVQDVLPSRSEETANGLAQSLRRARLRMRKNSAITAAMRVTLHSRGDLVMQIIAGPAALDDRDHDEWMLEAYATHG
ncbi:head-tail adaptor protein [Massilia genomosp. 1]|uniref:Head-tail adaptor protein n=1 Tax=Massilia genomosp. 1 TaxID=2609280 RepID=A0ABX0MRP1_9BURK|nr:head-tail adaptor protein [Massilia genomosp. 1]NHZ62615.1 hypothetical protein [Massilia genomosp. 1]